MSVLLPSGITPNQPRRATVITDASFCPILKVGGWAAWIKGDGGISIKDGGILPAPDLDSTVAEMMAAGNGIWLAAKAGATRILIQSDCQAVIHLVEGRTRSPKLLGHWEAFTALPIMAVVQLEARHVKGHGPIHNARTWVNGWCDKTAGQYMEQARAASGGLPSKTNRQGRSGGRKPQERSHPLGGVCPRP